jgi:hypothetical protein
MTDQEFLAMEKRVEKGETLPVGEKFLFEHEKKQRAQGPNILQQMAASKSPFGFMGPIIRKK